ncbi:MAG: trigger factor, partial [Chitinophagaceae bacterium]
LLNDKLTVTVTTADYQPSFEKGLKQYAKSANIPGFRKGMVPAGLIRKMYGQSLFTDEVLKTVEKEINNYLTNEKLEIFAQPLPLDNDAAKLDFNQTKDYSFDFEIGLKPDFSIPSSNMPVTKYVITVTDAMINEEVERLQTRFGTMTEPEVVDNEETVLNVTFTEVDAAGNVPENGINKANSLIVKYFEPSFRKKLMGLKKDAVVDVHLATAFEDKEREAVLEDLGLDKNEPDAADRNFKMTITKVGLVEKAAFNEEFFKAAYPAKEIASEEALKEAVKSDISAYYESQSRNQIHDQIYHHLLDNTTIELPESFLKRWLQVGGEKPKTEQQASEEYPSFANQLKWTLISSQLMQDEKVEVLPDDIKEFAKAQLFQYMGGQINMMGDNLQWVDDYVNRMMQDKKFVEDSYQRISTEKLFQALEKNVKATEQAISAEAFAEKLHHHHH